jgi:anti-sigma B factor antagonist
LAEVCIECGQRIPVCKTLKQRIEAMHFNMTTKAAKCVLDIQGQLDAITVPELRPAIGKISRDRPSELLVDLSGLRLIDSSGVGAIVSLFKTVRSYEGEMAVLGAQDQPLSILRLLHLAKVLFRKE